MFHHVSDEHGFKDERLFYRFQADEKSSVLNVQRKFDGEPRSAAELSEELRKKVTEMRDAFIKADGTSVDYEGIRKSDHLKNFARLAIELQSLDLGTLHNDEKKAFFINLYNSLVIHGSVNAAPLFCFLSVRSCCLSPFLHLFPSSTPAALSKWGLPREC